MLTLNGTIVNLDNLFEAYRKAKADVFFEKSQPMSIEFSQYEPRLLDNLNELSKKLTAEPASWQTDPTFIGGFGYLPKGLKLIPKTKGRSKQPATAICHFSECDPERAWELLLSQYDATAEFRAVAHFTVDMYTVCALWVNTIGHKFDRCLSPAARGSRLRRVGDNEVVDGESKYHERALGSFRPYYYDYRAWRQTGLNAIRRELKDGRRVIALTMDLASFYHRIDASFLLDDRFLERSGYVALNGPISDEERSFTKLLIEAFSTWGRQLPTWSEKECVGVPVGPSAPRIIANVVLTELDRLIEQNLSPVYYGRYVDDLFLVLRDPGTLKSADDVLKLLCERIPVLKPQKSSIKLDLPYAKDCQLEFKREKQRIFMLSGDVGLDFLETLEAKINEVSSEWRLLPNLDELENSPAARALTAAKDSDIEADSLRKADVLSIKRLGLSILLRNLDALSQDLPANAWFGQRSKLYQFMLTHVLTPARLLDLSEYVPRLLSLAVHCGDWSAAKSFINAAAEALGVLQQDTHSSKNGTEWPGFRGHLALALREAVFRSVSEQSPPESIQELLGSIEAIGGKAEFVTLFAESVARDLRRFDLARIAVRDVIMAGVFPDGQSVDQQLLLSADAPHLQERMQGLSSFLSAANLPAGLLQPLLFPTRPLHPAQIGVLVPACIEDTSLWREFTRVVRGVWVKVEDDGRPPIKGDGYVDLGGPEFSREPRICLTSFLVKPSSWSLAAEGKPDESSERYVRLMGLVNEILKANSKPDYVLFPELSVPRRWVGRLVSRLLPAGISLIAGVEYERRTLDGKPVVVNEAKLYLTDHRLGYPSHVALTQRKGIPAHAERDDLRKLFGVAFPAIGAECAKRVYRHRGFYFGVLLCSELTDIEHRRQFIGGIDAVFVLSWNRDLESFASMIEASALDLHCFMVLVNNRQYGDSRIRGPFREHWRRDLVRIKGGLDDFFVVAELEVLALREFQSHHEPPLKGSFKPTPEGYAIKRYRYRTPGA